MKPAFGGFYKKKRVLVTGHTGFKGAWLCLWLKELGAEVIGYSLEPPTQPNLFTVLELEKFMTSIIGDIRNRDNFKSVLLKYKPDVIFHLAAQPLVWRSYKEPYLTFETNIIGPLNIFESIREAKLSTAVVNVTTDKCYENKEQTRGYMEHDSLGGYDPYSASKACSEMVTSAYRNSFFNSSEYKKSHDVLLASARAGNVIGGGDWADDRILPDCVRAFSAGKKLVVRSPSAVRPWQHVLEPLSGYLLLGAKMASGDVNAAQAWNFGPSDESLVPVGEVVTKASKIWGGGECEFLTQNKIHETKILKLDIGKAKKNLSWTPILSIDEAMDLTINWYKEYYSGSKDMAGYTKGQIDKYVSTARKKNVIWSEGI